MYNLLLLFIFLFNIYINASAVMAAGTAYPRVVSSKTQDKNLTGLRIYDKEHAYNGYTLFTHDPIGIYKKDVLSSPIYLIDMNGNIIHKWMVDAPAFHARLLSNGNLMYHTTSATKKEDKSLSSFYGLYEIDSMSQVQWFHKGRINHDFQVLKDDLILYSENDERSPLFKIVTRAHILLWEWKAEEHIKELEKILGLQAPIDTSIDWAHNNACQMLPQNPIAKRDIRFKQGNILFCFSNLDLIGIVEYPSGKIVWTWGHGLLSKPHAPKMLPNGNILLFDNGSEKNFSRVIEMNPRTEKIVWEYQGDPPESFFSKTISNAQRLPNGNTLICEGNENRLFEITPDGKIVWDFISTFNRTTGGNGIYRAYRYSNEEISALLRKLE